jgi:hypothetical protein
LETKPSVHPPKNDARSSHISSPTASPIPAHAV